MVQYSELQRKKDLATLDIKDETNLTSELVTSKYKKLAKIHHPDKKTGNKEAFQNLHNAYERLSSIFDDDLKDDSKDEHEDYEKGFFRTSNFPLELFCCDLRKQIK